jgi:hypothetical protein
MPWIHKMILIAMLPLAGCYYPYSNPAPYVPYRSYGYPGPAIPDEADPTAGPRPYDPNEVIGGDEPSPEHYGTVHRPYIERHRDHSGDYQPGQ